MEITLSPKRRDISTKTLRRFTLNAEAFFILLAFSNRNYSRPLLCVKLSEPLVKPEVSHGDAMNQLLMCR